MREDYDYDDCIAFWWLKRCCPNINTNNSIQIQNYASAQCYVSTVLICDEFF